MSTAEPGYDPEFLGPPVPLPRTTQTVRELPSTHFTVLLDPVRRLAAATAVNIDGARLRDLPRTDDWHLDPRVPASEQAGPELYAHNDLDRGHLVRRRDPVWGPAAAAANEQTFAYPNVAPQASAFNQGEQLWAGLEDHMLTYASTYLLRLSVFTGPVLAEDDPVYRGVGIPRRFWKVAAWAVGGTDLRSAAFLLDQSSLIANLPRDVPPLRPFLTFQLPVADVEGLTGLDLGPLPAADVLEPATAARASRWIELTTEDDIVLGQSPSADPVSRS
ncbi:DNA/RNA non-specific endonuclease [Cellulomonas sp. URHD0024]|uniref:DNA/RNA non-specific endonuclease n=1 Tax=Cellulomonas sp. URHD0024 TaxID=1302620 RepID=UPI00040F19CF|nr:DNA/RNA non-specific endonuclease [Cellulomonas sp. URHD0024]